jgi:hypothetical protein
VAGPIVSPADPPLPAQPAQAGTATLTQSPSRHPFAVASPARRGHPRADDHVREASMSRYTATLGFTLVAIWIAIVFILVSGTTG